MQHGENGMHDWNATNIEMMMFFSGVWESVKMENVDSMINSWSFSLQIWVVVFFRTTKLIDIKDNYKMP